MEDDTRLPDEVALEAVEKAEVAEEAAQKVEAEVPAETPAEVETPAETPDSPPEEKSESAKRRDRRKAYVRELEQKKADSESRLDRIKQAASGESAPKEEEFDDPIEYAAAKALFDREAKDTQRKEREVSDEIADLDKRRQAELMQEFEAAKTEARGRYQDFDSVALRSDLPVTQPMASAILQADNGPDVLYHLGAHPQEALRISRLSDPEQVFELGRLSATLTAPKPKTVTEAPEPIKPVGTRAGGQRDPSKMSMPEYKKWRGLD